jgi:dipeptidyl aminopeptidase/acylaminoacyl peptidase
MRIFALSLIVFAAVVLGRTGAAETRGFTAQDLVTLQRISSPQVSPDGKTIVFVLRSTDMEANRGRTDLWKVGIDGSGLARLTTHEASDSSPLWAPDGQSVYFLSSRSGSSQVWRLPRAGGEAQPVTDLPLDVGNLVLSPDGQHLAVSMEVFVDCADLSCTKKRLEEREKAKTTGKVYDQLFFRHWDSWKDGRRSHLFVLPADGKGEPVDVTRGLDADVPSKPFGGPEEVAFTPDGTGIVFAARVAGREEPWSTDFDLYHAPIDGSKEAANITVASKAWVTHPTFSPDGKTLVYATMKRAGYEADRFHLVLQPWSATSGPAGHARILAEDWDFSVGDFFFSSDGATLFATARDTGQVPLFAITVADGKVRKLVAEGTVRSPVLATGEAGERIVYGLDHLRSPVDLYSVNTDGSDVRRLTRINQEALAEVEFGEAEQFSFPGWNGETVYGYAVKPVHFAADKKYPVAFLIHGGPQGSFSNNFHYRWNPQTYTGAGYAVVMIDFHGSTGYGQDFTDSIGKDWGGKPLEDLRKGLAAALDRYPWLDSERVGALGASYGGYMVNWIAGNWSDRFLCLVNHDGIFDQRMMYYATEELWFPEWEQGGPYFVDPTHYERDNPANFVKNWRTPMLVVQGGRDFRVPETQAFATFTALQRRGIPSRFLYFPDENHWVLKPHNSLQWHEEVLGWLDRWLKGEENG